MADTHKKTITGGLVALGGTIWTGYSHFTTARDLNEDAGWLVKFMTDPPVYAPWLLVFIGAVILASIFRKSTEVEKPQAKVVQETNGGNSTNFGHVSGPVTINYSPLPEPQPPSGASDHSVNGSPRRGWTEDGLDGLDRAVRGYLPKPDLPLNGLLVKVYKTLGGAPDDPRLREQFVQKVDLIIADAIVEHNLSVWGRIEDRPRQRIPLSHLRRARMRHRLKYIEVPVEAVHPVRYTDLSFNRDEVEQVWQC